MEDHLNKFNNFENNNSKDYSNNIQRTNHFKKIIKKKKKYIACNYNWKVFYSDDEDNNINQNLKLNDKNKNSKKRKFSYSSISIYKDNIYKKNTMDKTRDDSELNNMNKVTKIQNKKVSFLKGCDLVKYIDVESYKKYNLINANDEPFLLNRIENKVDLKCTCFIF